jgi:hypothetical protein
LVSSASTTATVTSITISQTSYATSTASADLTGELVPVAAVIVIAVAIVSILLARKRGHEAKNTTAGHSYCEKCGGKLKPSTKFCGHCGTRQSD